MLEYITKDAMRRFAFVFCVQMIVFGLQIWLSNLFAGPFSPSPEARFRTILLINSFSIAVGFLAAFVINIYPALVISERFDLSFEDSVLLVSKLQILYDKRLDQLTEEYIFSELEKEKKAIELI